ncbi:hypothetical protein [Haloarchaeobius sp. HRN-SO-5]|uniref:hypothetical protein n=1 Tax=Haloarchaeobius sp. HRN-SO-5 TaxID=3446118 RepID=UPI003EB9C7DE
MVGDRFELLVVLVELVSQEVYLSLIVSTRFDDVLFVENFEVIPNGIVVFVEAVGELAGAARTAVQDLDDPSPLLAAVSTDDDVPQLLPHFIPFRLYDTNAGLANVRECSPKRAIVDSLGIVSIHLRTLVRETSLSWRTDRRL